MSGGRLASGDLSYHVDIKLGGGGGVLLLRGVAEELFLRGVQLLLREDHRGQAGLDGLALRPLPNVLHAITQSVHTLLPLRLLVVLRVIGLTSENSVFQILHFLL